jgi:hypothetical protein
MGAQEQNSETTRIQSDFVRLTVKDALSGETYERELPISYLETANGILLRGESIDGKEVEMAFLSESALEWMRGFKGGGPDEPRADCPSRGEIR